MRRLCLLVLALPIAIVPRASHAMLIDFDGPEEMQWGERQWNGYSADQLQSMMRQQIQQALSTARQQGQDDWAWRDAVEERLTALGASAIPLLHDEMEVRKAYECDALATAIFRIQNLPLNPKESLTAWAAKSLRPAATMPADKPAPSAPPDLKIMHIMNRDLADVFPNHLFCVIESKSAVIRLVLAVAADSKIQPLPDDEALTKFMRTELEPTYTELGMGHASTAAALLALSRGMNAYGAATREEPLPHASQTTAKLGPRQVVAKVLFDEAGRVKSVLTTDKQGPEPKAVSIPVPDPKTPPPPMPE